MTTDTPRASALDSLPRPHVREDEIEQRIRSTDYFALPGTTVTICRITLDNGYSVLGAHACGLLTHPDEPADQRKAYEDAFRKLWPLFGFLLAEDLHRIRFNAPLDGIEQPANGLGFGDALEVIRAGGRVARAAWNGNMWLELLPGAGTELARIALMSASGTPLVFGALPLATDALCDDWLVVPPRTT